MNRIVITDIFGNKTSKDRDLNSKLPFILIDTHQPYLALEKISTMSEPDGIWILKKIYLEHLLYIHSINPKSFATVGDLWFPDNQLPDKLLLLMVNTDTTLSRQPVDFIQIDNYCNLGIWKPVCPQGYLEIGLIASPDKPSTHVLNVINQDYLSEYQIESMAIGRNTNMNEFNLLSNIEIKKYTIDRTKFLTHPTTIKLASKKTGNYVTSDKNRKLVVRKNANQKINYTVQGELILDGECIGTSMDDNIRDEYVYLQKCADGQGQKWYPYRDSYISQFDQSCLSDDSGILKKKSCDQNDENQAWLTEEYQESKINNDWSTEKGKYVFLVEPDVPWYITKKKTKPEGILDPNIHVLNQSSYDHATFPTKFMLDPVKPDLGYGYNYAQRLGRPCICAEDCKKDNSVIETFEDSKKNAIDFNLVACSLLLLIFLLVIVRFCLNAKKE
jgi:hypothetical protein